MEMVLNGHGIESECGFLLRFPRIRPKAAHCAHSVALGLLSDLEGHLIMQRLWPVLASAGLTLRLCRGFLPLTPTNSRGWYFCPHRYQKQCISAKLLTFSLFIRV